MTRIVVQIYEIQDPREAEAVIGLGVDRIGSVILSEKDWKVPAIKEVLLVSRNAGVRHSLIPLFTTESVLFKTVEYYQPDILHFCESLTHYDGRMMPVEPLVGGQVSIKDQFGDVEIMRTLPVGRPDNGSRIPTVELSRGFEAASDYFLLDTLVGSEPVEGFIGITGRPGDWRVAKQLVDSTSVPVILAGGLSPENVYEAIMAVKPFGVDSCTKTNTVDEKGRPLRFRKDYDKVKIFVEEARRAEKDLS